jgi:hypothetical protein
MPPTLILRSTFLQAEHLRIMCLVMVLGNSLDTRFTVQATAYASGIRARYDISGKQGDQQYAQ